MSCFEPYMLGPLIWGFIGLGEPQLFRGFSHGPGAGWKTLQKGAQPGQIPELLSSPVLSPKLTAPNPSHVVSGREAAPSLSPYFSPTWVLTKDWRSAVFSWASVPAV